MGATESQLPTGWGSAPREVLQHMFSYCELQQRCKVLGAVCSWWRQVSLENSYSLLLDLNLNRVPLFCKRTRDLGQGFYQQRASFMTWLLRRRDSIRRLSLTAERWEDDSQAVQLRMAVAEVVAAQLEALRLVCTESGRTTSAFLTGASSLKELQLDFWGRSKGLPRAMSDCTALTKLAIQCSSRLEHFKVLASLKSLQDLSVSDCDWERLPTELLQLPLTRLHLRFADLHELNWMPDDLGCLPGTLQELSLPGCQISVLPEALAGLAALTALILDRNYVRELPASLSRLRNLQTLSCEGCSALRQLPAPLAATLRLHSLNLLHTGVLRLPTSPGEQTTTDAVGSDAAASSTRESVAALPAYLEQLTELRWGVPEWEGGLGPLHRAALLAEHSAQSDLPDLEPLALASQLQVVQLAHLPSRSQGQVEGVQRRLPRLRWLQVNSAVLVG